ncbi:hypothetical protein ACQPVP_04735 [Clostridium nigeriense]|uniref:hypothetical protein n=1 Tax=Clostridium nigeriense TaxID=1805470 RepID=UPI003D32FFC2
MRGIYPWLYVDYKENLWRFSVNENKELNYGIMYTEGKWTKENLIDGRVTGFGLFIDNSEGIHLVYSNNTGELRYCTMKEKQWVGKVLYKVEDSNYSIESIKIEIIGTNMHIFYALASKDGSDHGVLMHCIWDGYKTSINKLQDIILKPSLKEYYLININNRNEIYLFYLSDEGDELSLNYSIYQNNYWLPSNRLYGIQGEDVYFDVELDNKNINILNKSKENEFYSLDHVVIDNTGSFKDFRVYEGKNNIVDPLIFKNENKICSCWIESNEIYYSIFTGVKWGDAKKYSRNNKFKIERYNAYVSEVKEGYIKERKLYATSGLDIYLYDLNEVLIRENKEYGKEIRNSSGNVSNSEEVKIIKAELYRVNEENKGLEERILNLNLLLQKNQQVIERYQQQVTRALEQKKKAEENSSIFLELQKKLQVENEDLSNEISLLKEEKQKFETVRKGYINEIEFLKDKINNTNLEISQKNEKIEEERERLNTNITLLIEDKKNIESRTKEYIEEIELLKDEINNTTKEILIKDKKIQEEIDARRNIESQNKIISEENLLMKKQLDSLIEENKKINTELEIEINKSVMEKLLRRRP